LASATFFSKTPLETQLPHSSSVGNRTVSKKALFKIGSPLHMFPRDMKRTDPPADRRREDIDAMRINQQESAEKVPCPAGPAEKRNGTS
jgi:hypothetical protein